MYQFTGQGQDLLAQARQLHTDSNDFRAKHKLERAAAALEMALKLRRTALISPHPVLTATVDSLSHLYQEMGNVERWRHYALQSIDEKIQMVGELHVETQMAFDNLQEACVAAGDFEGAADARRRSWNARTSTLGIKDDTVQAEGLIGDVERMLANLRKMVPSIRRSAEADHDLETRLRMSQGTVSTQAQVSAAQTATHALMHCDFNDRRPIKRDPELEQLLAERMTPADFLIQFGRPPDEKYRSGSQVYMDDKGNPAPPPDGATGATLSARRAAAAAAEAAGTSGAGSGGAGAGAGAAGAGDDGAGGNAPAAEVPAAAAAADAADPAGAPPSGEEGDVAPAEEDDGAVAPAEE